MPAPRPAKQAVSLSRGLRAGLHRLEAAIPPPSASGSPRDRWLNIGRCKETLEVWGRQPTPLLVPQASLKPRSPACRATWRTPNEPVVRGAGVTPRRHISRKQRGKVVAPGAAICTPTPAFASPCLAGPGFGAHDPRAPFFSMAARGSFAKPLAIPHHGRLPSHYLTPTASPTRTRPLRVSNTCRRLAASCHRPAAFLRRRPVRHPDATPAALPLTGHSVVSPRRLPQLSCRVRSPRNDLPRARLNSAPL
ncbi:hypothetical protein B0J12DRAFT_118705 [Macrophomina phaseolina]|uniref:Uncharacterized protein n=1 Tax=Macrophomina phaseolina TaxID=35725 RepID=A0ABQ8G7F7_9PEZI|nr:hypothetical protein B0J12DRAFT_118705 [Macrophomina phaseolina]